MTKKISISIPDVLYNRIEPHIGGNRSALLCELIRSGLEKLKGDTIKKGE